MLKLYDIPTARETILRRDPQGETAYPSGLLQSVERIFGEGIDPEGAVSVILDSVRREGDAALRHWSQQLDAVAPRAWQVPAAEMEMAFDALAPSLRAALELAVKRIRAFHARQPVTSWTTDELGGRLGQRVTPIGRVGVYVPGGSAPLPSSLLMSVIPAQAAGVPEIVVCTPPRPDPVILAAAHLCGIEAVYQVGGAQALAAMAFGTESIPRVDKIVGAGGLFVTLAKRHLYGQVGLDGLAGPTETMVIADESARPAWVAADLLAQAEHDPLASAILLTPSRELAQAVQAQVARQLESLSRAEIIAQSLERRGGVVLTPDLETAASLADEFAPEHLCLAVSDPAALADRIHNAGGLFLGERSFEVLGDYVAGPSHVMPTGGTARFASPLNVLDFIKITSIIALDDVTCRALCEPAAEIARAETLSAHAASARIRLEGEG